MGTEIKTWEIRNGTLHAVASSLVETGRLESLDLEAWIASDPSIVRPGLRLIGRQVLTSSGPLDLLAIDRSGDLVIIELKRDRLPREALAQAIDYAADIATWPIEKVGEVCAKYTGESLEDVFSSSFPDADLESVTINEGQRIVLVGFAAETSLERMIEWLSDNYGVAINAVILKYVRTAAGSEILTRTAIISDEIEEQRSRGKKFTIPMSDEPGTYDHDKLRQLLAKYLSQNLVTAQRIRDILLPACLEKPRLTRDELKQEFLRRNPGVEPAKAGFALSVISGQMGMTKNDFLRQVIGYEYPSYEWEKDNYFIRPEYRQLVQDVLKAVRDESTRKERV
jgi:hypothetical protein